MTCEYNGPSDSSFERTLYFTLRKVASEVLVHLGHAPLPEVAESPGEKLRRQSEEKDEREWAEYAQGLLARAKRLVEAERRQYGEPRSFGGEPSLPIDEEWLERCEQQFLYDGGSIPSGDDDSPAND